MLRNAWGEPATEKSSSCISEAFSGLSSVFSLFPHALFAATSSSEEVRRVSRRAVRTAQLTRGGKSACQVSKKKYQLLGTGQ
jgi:hypothetical protein